MIVCECECECACAVSVSVSVSVSVFVCVCVCVYLLSLYMTRNDRVLYEICLRVCVSRIVRFEGENVRVFADTYM